MKRRMEMDRGRDNCDGVRCNNDGNPGSLLHSLQLYFESAPGMANRFDIEVRSGDKNPRVVASCAAMAPGSDHKFSRGEFRE